MKFLVVLLFTLMAVHLGTCHLNGKRPPFQSEMRNKRATLGSHLGPYSKPVNTRKPASVPQNRKQRYPHLEYRPKRDVWRRLHFPTPVPHVKKF